MRLSMVAITLSMTLCASVFAKDDHHDCVEALDKLDSANQQNFSSDSHHEHQQAKEAHQSGDFKKCADQANKALSHMKKT